jgi:hypothetical protein
MENDQSWAAEWAASKEKKWKEEWGSDQHTGPHIYRVDVWPYKLLAELISTRYAQLG